MVITIDEWHNRHMQVSIDKAGRIVVPKPIRDRLGLRPDTALEIVESPEGILLKSPSPESVWRHDENGHLVYTGGAPAGIHWNTLVDDMREERIRKIGGW
jgi:AbrB family looped-hinge helix DNA binding protein